MKNFKEYFFIILVCSTSLFITIFILLNSWEVLSNIDIKYINSVQKLELQEPINKIIEFNKDSSNSKIFDEDIPSIGDLDYVQISSTSDRVFIGRERLIDGKWSFRPNNLHFKILNFSEKGTPGDYLFYGSKSWRTIPEPGLIQNGDSLTVFATNGRSYDFVVVEKKVLEYSDLYVPQSSNKRQLVILIDDPVNQIYYSFLARSL